ncbi:MAG: hypothetical protein E7672_09595 [Ruminococcaceae bacterium]|nr:hypothetical protein [Oscillospiraceae bacterium]
MKINIKKILIVAAATLITLSSVSCGKPADISDSSGVKRDPNSQVKDTAVDFNAVYSRTDGYIEKKKYPVVTVIKSRAEIELYTSQNEGQYDFYTTFYDAVTEYDAAFFEENALIVILLEEGSGSVTHKVKGVDYNSETESTVIRIDRVSPEEQTDDMAEWHIMVEIPKDSPVAAHADKITVEMTNVKG